MKDGKEHSVPEAEPYPLGFEEIRRMEKLAAEGRENEIFGICRVYRLWPHETSTSAWRSSAFQGEVVIRALNGERAREIASLIFRIGAARGGAGPSPWSDNAQTGCERIMVAEYPEVGGEAILRPPDLNHEVERSG